MSFNGNCMQIIFPEKPFEEAYLGDLYNLIWWLNWSCWHALECFHRINYRLLPFCLLLMLSFSSSLIRIRVKCASTNMPLNCFRICQHDVDSWEIMQISGSWKIHMIIISQRCSFLNWIMIVARCSIPRIIKCLWLDPKC